MFKQERRQEKKNGKSRLSPEEKQHSLERPDISGLGDDEEEQEDAMDFLEAIAEAVSKLDTSQAEDNTQEESPCGCW